MHKLPLYLASALLMCGVGQLRADEVKLTTALDTGENLALALNADLTATLTWGNGETQEINSDGSLLTIPVKDASFTITSTWGKISSLYVQGDKISALNLKDAANLKELYAADNQLATLDVSGCKKLEKIDVQGNQLTALTASDLTDLKELSIADNQISGTALRLSSSARLTHFVASHNALTSIPTASALSQAKTVWVAGNKLHSLALTQSKGLHSLFASSNELTSLTLAASNCLTDVWAENNSLTKIDLSAGSPSLLTLAADHNQLTEVAWDKTCKKGFTHAYLNDNALFINSMPPKKQGNRTIVVNWEPQSDYQMAANYDLNTEYNLNSLMYSNGWGTAAKATYTFVDQDGYTLVKGTDFKETMRKFTFFTSHAGVVCTVANDDYSFKTTAFTIGTPAAIGHVTAESGLSLSATTGKLSVTAQSPATVSIYNAAGIRLAHETVSSGTRTWQLPAGIYVVNGKKVIVP